MQLAESVVGLDRVQGEVTNVPSPLVVKLTMPVGAVGAAALSVTVTVHELATPMVTDDGVHTTLVVVGSSRLTVCCV